MPTFQPGRWNDASTGGTVQYQNNCYDYATDKLSGRTPPPPRSISRPGRRADQRAGTNNKELKASPYTCAQIEAAISEDGFTRSTKNANCGANCWKIAVMRAQFANGRTDFHFVREDSPGSWSHKQGQGPAKQTDDHGNPITDPATAVIQPYSVCAWFCVCSSVQVAFADPSLGSGRELVGTFVSNEPIQVGTASTSLVLEAGVYTLFREVPMARGQVGAAVVASPLIYSGEEGPSWVLSEREIEALSSKLLDLPPTREVPRFDSVYQGFLITSPSDERVPSVVHVFDGLVSILVGRGPARWYKDANGLERWLMNRVGRQQFGDEVKAVIDATTRAKRKGGRGTRKSR